MLNAANGQNINFRINNTNKTILTSSLLSIGVATKIEQTLSVGGHANLTSSLWSWWNTSTVQQLDSYGGINIYHPNAQNYFERYN